MDVKIGVFDDVIGDIKYKMDILQGFGAIPLKPPTDEQREEVEKE